MWEAKTATMTRPAASRIEALQRDADLALAQGVAGALGVGGVGHQGQDAGFAVVGETVQVHGAA